MTLFVLDSHSLADLTQAATAAGVDLDVVLDAMTELLERQEIECPPLVVTECRKYGGPSDRAMGWARTASAQFSRSSVSYVLVDEVVASCPEMVDIDGTEENPQVEVLALALARRREGVDAVVVTAQVTDTPLAMSLRTAALSINMPVLTPAEFIAQLVSQLDG